MITFQILSGKIDQSINLAKLPSVVCFSFLGGKVFVSEREKIFYAYSGPRDQEGCVLQSLIVSNMAIWVVKLQRE